MVSEKHADGDHHKNNPGPEFWAINFGAVGFLLLVYALVGVGIIPNKTLTLGIPGAGALNAIISPAVAIALIMGIYVVGGLSGLTCWSVVSRFPAARVED